MPRLSVVTMASAELVISAHDNFYERFGLMDSGYASDREKGMRQFIVGSGGAPLYRAVGRFPNSEKLVEAYGVLKLTLHSSSYDWEFVPAGEKTFTDSGSDSCDQAGTTPPGPDPSPQPTATASPQPTATASPQPLP